MIKIREVVSMKKLVVCFALALLMNILIIGCTSTESLQKPLKSLKEPPELTITIDDKKVDYVVGKNQWDGAMYDREDTFQAILKKQSEIPYVEIGSKVIISFTKDPPSEFFIADILIDEDGRQRYTDKEIISIPIELKDGKGYFEIKKHMASGLSSYYAEGKTDIRGFRMIAAWGENECEYAFIIRTDSF